MKKICLLLFLTLCSLPLRAQSAPGGAQLLEGPARDKAIAVILQANDLRTTLQFRFVMTRSSAMFAEDMVSRGRAVFVFPDKLRWEVEHPKPGVFVMDGVPAGDRRRQALLRNVAKLSENGLVNETDFNVTVYASSQVWQVDLVPLRRDLGQLFSRITLLTDAGTGVLRSVVLSGQGGDTTQLEISSVVRGAVIDPQLFQQP